MCLFVPGRLIAFLCLLVSIDSWGWIAYPITIGGLEVTVYVSQSSQEECALCGDTGYDWRPYLFTSCHGQTLMGFVLWNSETDAPLSDGNQHLPPGENHSPNQDLNTSPLMTSTDSHIVRVEPDPPERRQLCITYPGASSENDQPAGSLAGQMMRPLYYLRHQLRRMGQAIFDMRDVFSGISRRIRNDLDSAPAPAPVFVEISVGQAFRLMEITGEELSLGMTEEQLEKRFKVLQLKYHPDKARDNGEKLESLKAALNVLLEQARQGKLEPKQPKSDL